MRLDFARGLMIVVVAVSAAAPVAAADAGRYMLSASRDGFVRLDTATGAVSHCRPEQGVWRCEPLAAEDAATAARLDTITSQVTKLSVAVAALDARLAQLAPITPTSETSVRQPHNLVREALGRIFAMVRILKHGREARPDAT